MDNRSPAISYLISEGGAAHHDELECRVDEIVSFVNAPSAVLSQILPRENHQAMIDILTRLLESGSLSRLRTVEISKALVRFSETTGLRPTALNVQGSIQVLDARAVVVTPSSDTWRGVYVSTAVWVCLKNRRRLDGRSPDDTLKMLNREALFQWLGSRHSGILPIIGMVEVSAPATETFIVYPFFQGGIQTVLDHLDASPDADRRAIIRSVANAVAFLHDTSIIHGDLRGANILMKLDGGVYISNFASARFKGENSTSSIDQEPNSRSIPWKAPEILQAEEAPFATEASDIYAFASLMYEVFTCKSPLWEITRITRLVGQVCNQNRRPSKPLVTEDPFTRFGLTEEIWSVMELCWSVDPQARPTATHLVRAI